MAELGLFTHYLTIGATIALPSLSVSIGQGLTSKALMIALNRQPSAQASLSRLFFVAMALTETAGVLSTLIGMMFLLSPMPTELGIVAQIGAALTIAVPATFIGFLSAWPAQESLRAIARQPLMGQKMMNLLLISLSILQTPVIFGLIMSWLIQQSIVGVVHGIESLKLLASGLTLALGSIGPSIGLAIFAQQTCKTCSTNPASYGSILSFSFLSQAMIETPILFSFVIALFLYFTPLPEHMAWYTGVVYMCAAFAMGCSTFGTGVSSGRIARAACKAIGTDLKGYSLLSRASIMAQTLIDTNAIYGLIISLLMIFSLN